MRGSFRQYYRWASMGPLTFVSGCITRPMHTLQGVKASMGPLTFVSGCPAHSWFGGAPSIRFNGAAHVRERMLTGDPQMTTDLDDASMGPLTFVSGCAYSGQTIPVT